MKRHELLVLMMAGLSLSGLGCNPGTRQEGTTGVQPPPPTPPIKIEFTVVPGRGEGVDSRGNIEGVVSGIQTPAQYKIVVYALTDKWYAQPLTDDCLTEVKEDGTWSNWTHLGYRYVALLVRGSFRPPATLQVLPHVGGDVLARVEVPPGRV